MSTALAFTLPPALEAAEPPEARGLARDAVRLMVARDGEPLAHARFGELPAHLRAGDLLVVNESATLPAALAAPAGGDGPDLTLASVDAGARRGALGRRAAPRRRTRSAAPGRASGWRCRAAPAPSSSPRISPPAASGSPRSSCRRRCSTSSRATAGRSATRTSRGRDRWTTTRRSSRPRPAAPRCRAPGGRSRRASSTPSPRAASASRRSSSTPASARRSAASGRIPSASPSARPPQRA